MTGKSVRGDRNTFKGRLERLREGMPLGTDVCGGWRLLVTVHMSLDEKRGGLCALHPLSQVHYLVISDSGMSQPGGVREMSCCWEPSCPSTLKIWLDS